MAKKFGTNGDSHVAYMEVKFFTDEILTNNYVKCPKRIEKRFLTLIGRVSACSIISSFYPQKNYL